MTADDEILDLLLENARHSTADLARMTDHDEAEVEAAIDRLERQGVLRGYCAVVDWDRTDRDRVAAMVEVDVTPDRETGYDDVARRLAGFPVVRTVRLVTGDYDLAMEVEAESIGEVSRFVAEKVAPLEEVDGTVTHLVMHSFKEAGIELDDDDEDDRLSVSP